nr:uncharacterized protein LOC105712430 [Aotus nancymaae]
MSGGTGHTGRRGSLQSRRTVTCMCWGWGPIRLGGPRDGSAVTEGAKTPFSVGEGRSDRFSMRNSCRKWEGWGPMAHAVPDGAPCGWAARRGQGDRLQFSGTPLDLLTQWPNSWLLPSFPTPDTPRSGQLSCGRGGPVGDVRQEPARVGKRVLGALWQGMREASPAASPLSCVEILVSGKSSKRISSPGPKVGQERSGFQTSG